MEMQTESKKIINLLNKRAPEFAQDYIKNLDSCVIEMEVAIEEGKTLLESICFEKHIKPEETRRVHSTCDKLLETYYKFAERLKVFSSQVKTGFSFKEEIHQNLIRARSASVHAREGLYKFGTPKGVVACSTDSANYPFQGQCDSIEVEFVDPRHSFHYIIPFDKLLKDVQLSVEWTLRMYYVTLEQRLPPK